MWMDNPLIFVDGESVDRLHGDMYKTMQKSQRIFADLPHVAKVAQEIKNDIDSFRPFISVIQALRTPGMKERHWEQLAEESGMY